VKAESSSTPDTAAEKKPKKDKKENKEAAVPKEGAGGKKGGKAAPATAADDGEPVPSMIDLRVGHIVEGIVIDILSCCSKPYYHVPVIKHPDADGLYIEVCLPISPLLRLPCSLNVSKSILERKLDHARWSPDS